MQMDHLEFNQATSKIELLRVSGQKVLQKKNPGAFSIGLDVSNLEPGLYHVMISLEGGERIAHRLIIH